MEDTRKGYPAAISWDEVPGVASLLQSLADNRLAHSLLLYGQEYDSLEDLALFLAGHILGIPGWEPSRIRRHPDCFALRPVNKSRQISAENTRELIKNIQQTPREGDRKVAFVCEADRMNDSSANIFLKTLEEPPADTTILLLTQRPHGLLPTIRSRCHLIRVPTPSKTWQAPEVEGWMRDFLLWLDNLQTSATTSEGKSSVVMTLYGLTSRFNQIIEMTVRNESTRTANQLTEIMEDEEKLAWEAGLSVSLRQRFLGEFLLRLRDYSRPRLKEEPHLAGAYAETVREAHTVQYLLRLNYNASAAMEYLLLKTLRVWSRHTLRPES